MSRPRDAARNRRAVYTSPGTELVRRLAERGERIFTVKEAGQVASKVGLSAGYLHEGLHHLARSGWIVRLRKGLYALSGAVPGASPVHEFEIAMALVKPSAISHWSVLSHHGLTEQVPRKVFVLTTARSDALGIGSLKNAHANTSDRAPTQGVIAQGRSHSASRRRRAISGRQIRCISRTIWTFSWRSNFSRCRRRAALPSRRASRSLGLARGRLLCGETMFQGSSLNLFNSSSSTARSSALDSMSAAARSRRFRVRAPGSR